MPLGILKECLAFTIEIQIKFENNFFQAFEYICKEENVMTNELLLSFHLVFCAFWAGNIVLHFRVFGKFKKMEANSLFFGFGREVPLPYKHVLIVPKLTASRFWHSCRSTFKFSETNHQFFLFFVVTFLNVKHQYK